MRNAFVTAGLVSVLASLGTASKLSADELPALLDAFSIPAMAGGNIEFSSGMSGTAQGWSSHGSATISPFSAIDEDGWRLKLGGHYAQYSYTSREDYVCEKNESAENQSDTAIRTICNQIRHDGADSVSDETENFLNQHGYTVVDQNLAKLTPHKAERFHVSFAPGYRVSLGTIILKSYFGIAYRSETVMPEDPSRSTAAESWGAEASLEAWTRLGDQSWFSADGSYFTGTQSYSAEGKIGFQPASWLSIGPEAAAYGDNDDASGRAGAFVRFDNDGVETTLSGGVTGTFKDEPSLYGAANVFVRF